MTSVGGEILPHVSILADRASGVAVGSTLAVLGTSDDGIKFIIILFTGAANILRVVHHPVIIII